MGLYDTITLPLKCSRCKRIEEKHDWQTKGMGEGLGHFKVGDNVPVYGNEIIKGKVEIHTICPRCKKFVDAMASIEDSKITDKVIYKKIKLGLSGRPWKANKNGLKRFEKLMRKNTTVVSFRIHKSLKEEMDKMDRHWDTDIRNAIEKAIAKEKGMEEITEVERMLKKISGRRAHKAARLMEQIHMNWIRLRQTTL